MIWLIWARCWAGEPAIQGEQEHAIADPPAPIDGARVAPSTARLEREQHAGPDLADRAAAEASKPAADFRF